MIREEVLQLQAERQFLQQRLAGLPHDAQITRKSGEARLRSVDALLAAAKIPERQPVRARLLFRGRPVVGSHGIFAEFGAAATQAFADVVTKMAAATSRPLSAMGPIPNRQQSQLLITGTPVGSFGFELEEHQDDQFSFEDQSPTAQALELTQSLLQSTLGTDDELADAAAATDPRALAAVRSFLESLASNDAVCTLESEGRSFRFEDVGQVRRSLERIGRDNLVEEEQELDGEFQGVLPKRRSFEFKLAAQDEVIGGKVGPAITDADTLNAYLHQPSRIKVLTTRVGNGRPRYVLLEQPRPITSAVT